jgi:aspartyl-tRNA synthetase
MAFTGGDGVMNTVENLIKDLYKRFAKPDTGIQEPIEAPLPDQPFIRMPYEEAMSKYGSDKPDLRIPSLVSEQGSHSLGWLLIETDPPY